MIGNCCRGANAEQGSQGACKAEKKSEGGGTTATNHLKIPPKVNLLSISYHYIMTVTLSLRRPNQILSTPQHKFPIESSQMNHKTAIRSFSEKFIKMPTDSHHNKMCDFQWRFFQNTKFVGNDLCGLTSFVSAEQSIGVSAATSPGARVLLAHREPPHIFPR